MPDLGYILRNPRAAIENIAPRYIDRRPEKLPRGRYISFCFDDFPKTAVDVGADLLDKRGLKATYYVAGGLMGTDHPDYGAMFDADDLTRVANAGHEIGCHTFSHLDCSKANADDIIADCTKNGDFFDTHGLPAPRSFAYPYGAVSLTAKRTLRATGIALRGARPGAHFGSACLSLLNATSIQDDLGGAGRGLTDLETLEGAESAWLILFTHDIRESHSPWGCTAQEFEGLLDTARNVGDIVTVGDMAGEIRAAGTVH